MRQAACHTTDAPGVNGCTCELEQAGDAAHCLRLVSSELEAGDGRRYSFALSVTVLAVLDGQPVRAHTRVR
jgi:hypothetical protein